MAMCPVTAGASLCCAGASLCCAGASLCCRPGSLPSSIESRGAGCRRRSCCSRSPRMYFVASCSLMTSRTLGGGGAGIGSLGELRSCSHETCRGGPRRLTDWPGDVAGDGLFLFFSSSSIHTLLSIPNVEGALPTHCCVFGTGSAPTRFLTAPASTLQERTRRRTVHVHHRNHGLLRVQGLDLVRLEGTRRRSDRRRCS